MSTTTDPKSVEQAGETVFTDVYVPVFIKACADRGVVIETEEDLNHALESALALKAAEAESSQTNDSDNIHKSAHAALKQLVGEAPTQLDADALAVEALRDGNLNKAASVLASLNS